MRRVKASPAMEAFAPKYAAMAEDYADRATLATLFFDASQATRLADVAARRGGARVFHLERRGDADRTRERRVLRGLRHAVARSLGVVEDVG